ncbi:MAG: dihydrofolate reductase [Desulfatitalea sp.]|nr:dihydrofolate reductase family protein [Desulfatitalea sp.]NNK02653.1 dihydrofolate reductase [Desulfatitalea sp.]
MKLILLMAMTADGKIARNANHFPDWTGRADKRMFKRKTLEAGVVIMGARTYDTIGKPLAGRLNVVMTRHPERYRPAENLVLSCRSPGQVLDDVASRGFETVILAGGATINAAFARRGLINEMILTITPVIFGTGLSLFSEPIDLSMDLLNCRELEPNVIVLHYALRKDVSPSI